jgi:hypothetical protein
MEHPGETIHKHYYHRGLDMQLSCAIALFQLAETDFQTHFAFGRHHQNGVFQQKL